MPALKCEKERKLKEKKLKYEEGHVTTGKKNGVFRWNERKPEWPVCPGEGRLW